MTPHEVEISPRAAGQIRNGSLWIFANEFVTKMKLLEPGSWVNFLSSGRFIGHGYVNPHSLISGRICSLLPVALTAEARTELIAGQLKKAVARRGLLPLTNAYRACFSESDGLPGLIVDVYGKTVVAQFTTLGMDKAKAEIIGALSEVFTPDNIVIRADGSIRHLEGATNFIEVVKGDEASLRDSVLSEDGVQFAADFVSGQKTGFFLDQRENRLHLKSVAKDKTVLDLCCYSGGWGLSALAGGASRAVFVDQSKEALMLVRKGLSLNGFGDERATFLTSDVFDYLETPVQELFDVVVCDPPAFVKSKKNLPQALKAYAKLNTQALKRLGVGGLFYSCSCSYHISDTEFLELLRECVQKSGRVARVVYQGTQAVDHPWILNRPESKYLKCYGLEVT